MSDETNEVTNEETSDVATDVMATEPSDVATDVLEVEPSTVATDVMHAAASDPVDDGRANPRKVREGIVISDKMDSTLVVAVHERVRHPRYDKTVQRTKKLYVHDEKNEAKIGDKVRVQETRPLSKLKRWRLTEIVERAR
jgi:small subunit ribosomal protein S17